MYMARLINMSKSQLTNILLKNSTERFYIEYEGFLMNHMSHGIVALARLGANTERIERFVDWYRPRLEDGDSFRDGAKIVDSDELLGAKKSYYALLDDYKRQLNEEFGGSMENLISDKFPKLFPGLMGAALHGSIHLGYGYAVKNSQAYKLTNMSESQLTNILLKNSTDRFYIQYKGHLMNHVSHGIVALARLGANTERIERFVDWLKPRMEDGDSFRDGAKIVDSDALLGARKSYYALLDDYKRQLNEEFDGAMEYLILDKFPKLFPGLMGAALHGSIHLGYGYAVKSSQLVCEGLAYMHFTYLPLKPSSLPLSVENIGKGSCEITDVIESVRQDTELSDFMKTKAKSAEHAHLHDGKFLARVRSLLFYRADDLLRYVYSIRIPIIEQMEDEEPEIQCTALLQWLLESAIAVYTLAEKNDFYLLHGVTAAWSFLQFVPLTVGKSRPLTLELATYYLCALLATYISQRTLKLCPELLVDDAHQSPTAWTSIIDSTLEEDRDEHVYKLIQVCHDLSQGTDNQHLQKLYVNAALRALNEPLNF